MKQTIIAFCPKCGFAIQVPVEIEKVVTQYITPVYHFKPTVAENHTCEGIQDQ